MHNPRRPSCCCSPPTWPASAAAGAPVNLCCSRPCCLLCCLSSCLNAVCISPTPEPVTTTTTNRTLGHVCTPSSVRPSYQHGTARHAPVQTPHIEPRCMHSKTSFTACAGPCNVATMSPVKPQQSMRPVSTSMVEGWTQSQHTVRPRLYTTEASHQSIASLSNHEA